MDDLRTTHTQLKKWRLVGISDPPHTWPHWPGESQWSPANWHRFKPLEDQLWPHRTDITVILNQWTQDETIPGRPRATKPFIYILMMCKGRNAGRWYPNVSFKCRIFKRLLQQFWCWQVFGWAVSSLAVGRGWRRNPVALGRSFYDYHCLHLTIISQQSGIKSY